jgi:hypothetical protein
LYSPADHTSGAAIRAVLVGPANAACIGIKLYNQLLHRDWLIREISNQIKNDLLSAIQRFCRFMAA